MTDRHADARLRIVHLTATFPPYYAGTGNVCFHNARELARRGHDVTVITAARGSATRAERRDGITILRLRPIARVGNAPLLPGLLLALRGYDLIHLHYPFILGAEVARVAALLFRTPLVVTFHNDLIGQGIRAPLFSTYQRVSALLTINAAARLCVVSRDHYRESRLRTAVPGSGPGIVALPNGVDSALFAPQPAEEIAMCKSAYGIAADAPLVLFVAALDRAHHFKGLDVLLRAMVSLQPRSRLLVVGSGDMRDAYERQAADLGLAGRVIFAGAIPHDELPVVFASADVTVLPSSPPESFGMVLIESMACGTPVIASDIPGVRTLVDEGIDGYLVPCGHSEALASAIGAVLDVPPQDRIALGRAGREKVRAHYDWSAIGQQLEAIYRELGTNR